MVSASLCCTVITWGRGRLRTEIGAGVLFLLPSLPVPAVNLTRLRCSVPRCSARCIGEPLVRRSGTRPKMLQES